MHSPLFSTQWPLIPETPPSCRGKEVSSRFTRLVFYCKCFDLKKKKPIEYCIPCSYFILMVQELAGYFGGDARFLKEDFEIQLNKSLFWDSVRSPFYTKILE